MDAARRVKDCIREYGLIERGDHVILGISGGPDSLCLLDILSGLKKDLGFSLSCLHVNHMVRGEEADADAEWLSEYIEGRGIHLKTVKVDVPLKAAIEGLSVEEAGRNARREALFAEKTMLEEAGVSPGSIRIALAHNKNDQAETVLMRIIRGSGVHGLAAMEPKAPEGIIRPLLFTPREEIELYCSEHGLSPRIDATNSETEYTRNRIRLELLPKLCEYNPQAADALVKLSRAASEDDACLSALAEKVFAETWNAETGELTGLGSYYPSLAKRVIRLALSDTGLAEDVGSIHINAALRALTEGRHGAVIEFPRGFKARVSYGKLVLEPPTKEEAISTIKTLRQAIIPAASAPDFKTLPENKRLFDYDKVCAVLKAAGQEELTFRYRKQGDRIVPLGMKGTKKLSDFFVDAKVPREQRDLIPMVAAGSEVLWIYGGAVSELTKIDGETNTALLLEMI